MSLTFIDELHTVYVCSHHILLRFVSRKHAYVDIYII